MLKTIENKPKEQIISCWLPPKKHLVQYFAEKVQPDNHAPNEVIFDSDQSESDFSDEEDDFDKDLEIMAKPHKDPSSYAWLLIRFACVTQQYERLKQFIQVAGFDFSGNFFIWIINLLCFRNSSAIPPRTQHCQAL